MTRPGPCIVTGAASGIGRAIADGLVVAGWKVAYLDINPIERPPTSENVLATACDVTDEHEVKNAFEAVQDHFQGELWGCFANAGVSGGSDAFVDVSIGHFREVLERNLIGCFLTMREAARVMGSGGGRIVATSSVAGLRGSRATGTPYAAAKAAIINMVQQSAIRLVDRAITVNAICPGPIATNVGGGALRIPQIAAKLAREVPAGYIGVPEDVVPLALMFAETTSRYITGQVVAVDGGMSSLCGSPRVGDED